MATRPQAAPSSPPQPAEPAPAVAQPARTGARLLLDVLLEEGVEVIFGFSGGAILPTFDVLYDAPIRFFMSRCEQGAGHMADGYARATGKVGTVVVTSGPGATNLTTALATAYMDSIPMVAITGQVATAAIGNDAFQEADVVGVTRPVTKHNVLVKSVEDLPRILREAYHVARTGRPGPVLVDLPKDVQVKTASGSNGEMNLPGYRPRVKGNSRQIRLAAEAINASERPVLYVGGGVISAGASAELRQMARKGHIPVTTTLLGMGAIDEVEDADLALNMLGMHGSAYANFAVQASDMLIAVGARFDDRVTGKLETFAPQARIIHIDVDPSSISKNVDVDIPVVGDARSVLQDMLPLIEYRERAAWFGQIARWKAQYPFQYQQAAEGTIKPQHVICELGRLTGNDAIITTGVGQHQMWAAQFYRWRFPRQMITSGGLGTMGYGLPAAIGACIGVPGRPVIDIDGDGSFLMTCNELATAAEYGLPVKVVILNNHWQGMVRQWQELFFGRRYMASRMVNPSFAKVAEAFGCTGIDVRDVRDLPDAIARMLAAPGPVVMDVHVEPEENVYPMVAVGKSLHEMEMGGMA